MDYKAFWRDFIYLLIGKILGKQVIYQIHGGKLPNKFFPAVKFFKLLLILILKLPDCIVVLTKEEFCAYKSFVSAKWIELIPNAIDIRPFEKYQKSFSNTKKFRIIYIGALRETKGIQYAIDAIAILMRERPLSKIEFHIAGSGAFESNLKKQIVILGLTNIVFFHNPKFGNDKLEFLQNAHIFLFPTLHEGLPYSTIEAMAAGTPLITTRVGGHKDAIEDKVHGLFIKKKSPQDIANKIRYLMQNPEILALMSNNCKYQIKKLYDINRLVYQFEKIYNLI